MRKKRGGGGTLSLPLEILPISAKKKGGVSNRREWFEIVVSKYFSPPILQIRAQNELLVFV